MISFIHLNMIHMINAQQSQTIRKTIDVITAIVFLLRNAAIEYMIVPI